MEENESELCLKVTGIRRDGRKRYDPQSKRQLAQACMEPGVSLAGMALKQGVNANLLRKWVMHFQLESGCTARDATDTPANAFVPVVVPGRAETLEKGMSIPSLPTISAGKPTGSLLRAQLPNGVRFEFECAAQDAVLVSAVIDALGRCDVAPGR